MTFADALSAPIRRYLGGAERNRAGGAADTMSAEVLSAPGRCYLAAAVLMAALPGLLALPAWVTGLATLAFATHWLPGPPRIVLAIRLSFLTTAAAIVALSFSSWRSGEAALAFLSIAVVLKWVETHSLRDARLTAAGSVILCALGLASWTDERGMALAVAALAAVTLALLATTADADRFSVLRRLRAMARLIAPALLVAAALFLAFPRIPGPLWNFGMALGLPIGVSLSPAEAGLGFQSELDAGTGRGGASAADDDIVLVARFDDKLPPRNELYWRGPVFGDFDGLRWTLPAGWDQRNRLLSGSLRSASDVEHVVSRADSRVSYAVRLAPHGGFWLYGLDLPLSPVTEAVISKDLQLVSIRKVEKEERYSLRAALNYAAKTPLSSATRQEMMALPPGAMPRLASLGRELRERGGDDKSALLAAQKWLAGAEFVRDEHAYGAEGMDALDTIMFDARRGGVQRLAEAFTLLLRAAGLPARLVTGYRGGAPIALTTVLIVRRTHAHAWTEVWLEGEGWRRVDPLDLVGIPTAGAPQGAAPAPAAIAESAAPASAGVRTTKATRPESVGGIDAAPWLAAVVRWFRRVGVWVTKYDPTRQTNLFQSIGFARVDASLLGAISAAAAALACLPLLLLSRAPRRRDALAEAYSIFQTACARLGYPRAAWECPQEHAKRVAAARPELAPWIDDISGRYLQCRYGRAGADIERRAAVAALRRQSRRFAPIAAARQQKEKST